MESKEYKRNFFIFWGIIAFLIALITGSNAFWIGKHEVHEKYVAQIQQQMEDKEAERAEIEAELFTVKNPQDPWITPIYGTQFYYLPAQIESRFETPQGLWVNFSGENHCMYAYIFDGMNISDLPDTQYLLTMEDVGENGLGNDDIIVTIWMATK